MHIFFGISVYMTWVRGRKNAEFRLCFCDVKNVCKRHRVSLPGSNTFEKKSLSTSPV